MSWVSKMFGGVAVAANPTIKDSYAGYSNSDFSTIAMRIVSEHGVRVTAAWIGGTVEQCDRVLAKIPALRERYRDVEPKILRREISDWLDYYEGKAREEKNDIINAISRKRSEAYRVEESARRDRERDLVEKLRANNHWPSQ